jgi:hypothetical protein
VRPLTYFKEWEISLQHKLEIPWDGKSADRGGFVQSRPFEVDERLLCKVPPGDSTTRWTESLRAHFADSLKIHGMVGPVPAETLIYAVRTRTLSMRQFPAQQPNFCSIRSRWASARARACENDSASNLEVPWVFRVWAPQDSLWPI